MANPLAVARVKTDSLPLIPSKKALEQFLTGKDKLAEVLLCSILAKGHVLFERHPWRRKNDVGKGAFALARLSMARVSVHEVIFFLPTF